MNIERRWSISRRGQSNLVGFLCPMWSFGNLVPSSVVLPPLWPCLTFMVKARSAENVIREECWKFRNR